LGIVLRISEHAVDDCCVCAQPVAEVKSAVQLFVFWPGDEDPARWLAHERCVAERTMIRQQPLAEQKEHRPSSKRDRAG
jgi:hypothetical protein